MNNFGFLNLMNPQIVRAKDVDKKYLNDKYFVEIPAFFGYDNILSCSIYLYINDKLIKTHEGNELYSLISTLSDDLQNILRGSKDYVLGEDYFISETFFEYCLQHSDIDDNSNNSTSSGNSSSNNDSSSFDDDDVIQLDPHTFYIIVGRDIITAINLRNHNREWIEQQRKSNIDELTEQQLQENEYQTFEEKFKAKYVLPDYIDYYSNNTVAQNTVAWYDLSNTNNKDMANIDYFYNKNVDRYFSDESIYNIPKTFFNIILKYAVPQNYYNNINNQIYNLVMKYYANNETDDTTSALKLILGTLFTTQQSQINCGCDAVTSSNLNTSNCIDNYMSAMFEYLKKMLADTEYYYDWFFIPIDGKCPMPNDTMIDLLILLLNSLLDMNLNMSFTKQQNHCACPTVNVDESACNRAIIENYIHVLQWVKNNDIDANANKIKIYGTQFAELFPKLLF